MIQSLQVYDSRPSYDELFEPGGRPRPSAQVVSHFLSGLGERELRRRQKALELDIRAQGITFTVYGNDSGVDRKWPMDVIPRVISVHEWGRIAQGLEQRLLALNLFIDDLYHQQMVVRDRVFPYEVLQSSKYFLKSCIGQNPKFGVWAHIAGTDLIRDDRGRVYVLEDNLRIPSGVSYMLENRLLTKRALPELFDNHRIQPVDGYIGRLIDLLVSLAPRAVLDPTIVVLTPGVYNSAYFEHCYLAQRMGVELVEGQDLVVDSDDCVYMKTIGGLVRVHVIYRRVADEFLDPDITNPDSTLGCRGLFRAWRAGNVALVNAPGAGVADDKLVYSYVPDLIRYYLKQEPILENVETYRLFDDSQRKKVLSDLRRYVIKPVNESGGYGVVVGDRASEEELAQCRRQISADPRNYVAQPIICLSTAPTLCATGIEPRHLDLRPFILSGESRYVTRGGLTRVALKKGSLVVNSSQGGGSKDTWIVEA
jgi:uncharacterized circularly permuted ATP-grasp superfamily protein